MDQETTARFERIETNIEKLVEETAEFKRVVRGAIMAQQEQIADLTRRSAKHDEQILELHKQFLAYLVQHPPQ